MILYISGYGSEYKQYIDDGLNKLSNNNYIYYVIKNDFKADTEYLKDVVENNTDITIISHSTGGFYSLILYRLYTDKITSVHLINPAINLYDCMVKSNRYDLYLKSCKDILIDEHNKNLEYYNNINPINLYQGLKDDSVDLDYNFKFIKNVIGNIIKYDNLGHRFNENEFNIILKRILKRISTYIL